jgi:hypothetical protein
MLFLEASEKNSEGESALQVHVVFTFRESGEEGVRGAVSIFFPLSLASGETMAV